MIGNSTISIDDTSNFTIKGKRLKGTQVLWELLTRRNVNTGVITEDELKKYKIFGIKTLTWRDMNPEATFKHFADLNLET